jgi:hypothetical protein
LLNVIAELPRYVDDAAFPVGLRVAAVDAFFILRAWKKERGGLALVLAPR